MIILTTFWALVGEEDEQDSENDISKEKVDPKEGSKEDTKEMSSNEIKQELTTVIDTPGTDSEDDDDIIEIQEKEDGEDKIQEDNPNQSNALTEGEEVETKHNPSSLPIWSKPVSIITTLKPQSHTFTSWPYPVSNFTPYYCFVVLD